MFSKAVYGTKVQCKLLLHKTLIPRPADGPDASLTKELMSADEESDITYSFEFGTPAFHALKEYFHTKKFDDNRPEKPSFVDGVPFQVCICMHCDRSWCLLFYL